MKISTDINKSNNNYNHNQKTLVGIKKINTKTNFPPTKQSSIYKDDITEYDLDCTSDIVSDYTSEYEKCKATLFTGTTSVLSGVFDVFEKGVDGVLWLGGHVISLVGADDTNIKNLIAENLVDNANDYFYTKTKIGQDINSKSYLKYDSDVASKIENITEVGTEIAVATGLTVVSGGAASAIFGASVGFGSSAESTYQKENTGLLDEGTILLSGGLNALSWQANGKLTANFIKDTSKALAQYGAKETSLKFVSSVCNFDFMKDMAKKSLFSKEATMNYVGAAFMSADDVADVINSGEKVSVKTIGGLSLEYLKNLGLNVLEDTLRESMANFGSVSKVKKGFLSDDEEFYKMFDDSGKQTKVQVIDELESINKDDTMFDVGEITEELPIIDGRPHAFDDEITEELPIINDKAREFDGKEITAELPIIDDGIPAQKGIDSEMTELASQFRRVTRENTEKLKEEILSTVGDIDSPVQRAKKLYNELNMRMHYDTEYMVAPRQGGSIDRLNEIYNREVDFSNLTSTNVICKDWSYLYAELLVDSGFKKEQVKIVGDKKIGSHKWVILDLLNGTSIACDATDAIEGGTDLFRVKAGMQTKGFLPFNSSRAKIIRPIQKYRSSRDELHLGLEFVREVDTALGYVNLDGDYEMDVINKVNNLFANNGLTSKVFNKSKIDFLEERIQNIELPNNMDGLEGYCYYTELATSILGEKNYEKAEMAGDLSIKFEINNLGDCISVLNFKKNNNGKIYVIGQSGRAEFDDYREYAEFLNAFLNLS